MQADLISGTGCLAAGIEKAGLYQNARCGLIAAHVRGKDWTNPSFRSWVITDLASFDPRPRQRNLG